MFFALCRFELFIPHGRSLKGKRSVISGIKDRLRVRFRASVAEVAGQDLHQRGTLAVALVGASPTALEAALGAMRRLVEQEQRCVIVSWATRVEPFEGAPGAPLERLMEPAPSAGDEAAWDAHEEGDEYYGPARDRGQED